MKTASQNKPQEVKKEPTISCDSADSEKDGN